jgi:hypothetical protein
LSHLLLEKKNSLFEAMFQIEKDKKYLSRDMIGQIAGHLNSQKVFQLSG